MTEISFVQSVELREKIAARTARIGVFGLGYVGLPLALLFIEQGFPVTGFDIDEKKVAALNDGCSYIVRILAAEIEAARKRGFHATSDFTRILAATASGCAAISRPSGRSPLRSAPAAYSRVSAMKLGIGW